MRSLLLTLVLLMMLLASANSQQYGFEPGSSHPFRVGDAGSVIQLVNAPYKEGVQSMQWVWTAPSRLICDYTVTHNNFRDGVIFWVYNDTPLQQPLRVEYRDANNQLQYYFNFGLNYSGWRICRIGSKYMQGTKTIRTGLKLNLVTPQSVATGRLYIDRFSFVSDVNYQNAPDAQQPANTEENYITHWNSLWKWESTLSYSKPLLPALSSAQLSSLQKVEDGLTTLLPSSANTSLVTTAKTMFEQSGITQVNGFLVGKPLVVKPDKTAADHSLAELGTMMMGLAQDALYASGTTSAENYVQLWRYALNQGFAWGSAMGNNHHYGYETRQIFASAFMMRQKLTQAGLIQQVADALSFWSGLPETRSSLAIGRDGVVDCWNTLLVERLISAMLNPTLNERYRAVDALIEWTSSSLLTTPGNMGGLKPDGSVFHHAGHYPAYAIGGFEGLTGLLTALSGSGFTVSDAAFAELSKALTAMKRYTNANDWTIGISGRHPHQGAMPEVVYNRAVQLGLLSTQEPQGFFVMNHAALGIHRNGSAMVTIKGYNNDVWGSEIYTNDNRYGRYQSYGAVEILNGGNPVSRAESRYTENGWDWNRLPGTTAIQLPLNLLESPVTSTLMARSAERFAGASALTGVYGAFGMKLHEMNDINNTNYSPDFRARKSVFAFGKKIICIGNGIQTSNAVYPVETTLFQQAILSTTDRISVNSTFAPADGYSFSSFNDAPLLLSDPLGNYYRIASQQEVKVEGKLQLSRHNKTKAETSGKFSTAILNHGKAPSGAAYEYMILLKPNPIEARRATYAPGYRVLQADASAHAVLDSVSGVQAWVCFNETTPLEGLLKRVDAETIVMFQQTENRLTISVCDPSLYLQEKTKNSEPTYLPGQKVQKKLELKGQWTLLAPQEKVRVESDASHTTVTVDSELGTPIEFELQQVSTSLEAAKGRLQLQRHSRGLTVVGATTDVSVYHMNGQLVDQQSFFSEYKTFYLQPQAYILVATLPDTVKLKYKYLI